MGKGKDPASQMLQNDPLYINNVRKTMTKKGSTKLMRHAKIGNGGDSSLNVAFLVGRAVGGVRADFEARSFIPGLGLGVDPTRIYQVKKVKAQKLPSGLPKGLKNPLHM